VTTTVGDATNLKRIVPNAHNYTLATDIVGLDTLVVGMPSGKSMSA